MVESIHNADSSDAKHDSKSLPHKDEVYRIYSKIDILYILRDMMQKNTLITLYFDRSNQFILTSILALDENKNEMLIDVGAEPKFNEAALASKHLTFITSQNRIKIEFTCDQIKTKQFEGRSAFAVELPASLIRMQRRNYFRISTPTTKPLKCIIPLQTRDTPTKAEITLLDISCGGIGVIDHHPVIHFDPGVSYHNCQIDLPGTGRITTTIQVKNTYEITLKGGQTCKRAGCQFIDLPKSMEIMIQRYITKQEQTRINS
ncbi:flagellar brake protein [Nitrosomonas aestuarii]|uniref:flagellar brake protein n=1 Tax=Nitrosomonas aestuarii TaxID=52441 RepID=UPI000D318842|nr:flagellar brake protein [Nitrosomonas aestuarii]PTN13130.1 c-di-GMP-binding flagellar brake protein YcgR [Nitrosomonas aestuarii]